MLFDFSNYWLFLVAIATVYIVVLNFAQANMGGKNKLQGLQAEMRKVQLKMTDAAKNKDDTALNGAISENWKLTMELMKIQMGLTVILLIVLFGLMHVFPYFEPGTEDDIAFPLYDDGLQSHCDAAVADGNYSACLALPANATKGAWTVDAYLNSSTGELLARSAAAIYYEGGKPEDVWLQRSQPSFIDSLIGKKAYALNVTAGKENYTSGETVAIRAAVSPPVVESAVKLSAVADSGTFFYVDLPFPLPLLNIRRIIGSYGVFLFFAFVMGIAYSIMKAIYSQAMKKK